MRKTPAPRAPSRASSESAGAQPNNSETQEQLGFSRATQGAGQGCHTNPPCYSLCPSLRTSCVLGATGRRAHVGQDTEIGGLWEGFYPLSGCRHKCRTQRAAKKLPTNAARTGRRSLFRPGGLETTAQLRWALEGAVGAGGQFGAVSCPGWAWSSVLVGTQRGIDEQPVGTGVLLGQQCQLMSVLEACLGPQAFPLGVTLQACCITNSLAVSLGCLC